MTSSAPFRRFAFAFGTTFAVLYVVALAKDLALFTVFPSLGIVLAGTHHTRDVADPALGFLALVKLVLSGPTTPPAATPAATAPAGPPTANAIAPTTAVVTAARRPIVCDPFRCVPKVSDAPTMRRNDLRTIFIAVLDKIHLPIYDKLEFFPRQPFLDANIRPRQ